MVRRHDRVIAGCRLGLGTSRSDAFNPSPGVRYRRAPGAATRGRANVSAVTAGAAEWSVDGGIQRQV